MTSEIPKAMIQLVTHCARLPLREIDGETTNGSDTPVLGGEDRHVNDHPN